LFATPYALLWNMNKKGLLKTCSLPDLTAETYPNNNVYYYVNVDCIE